MGENTLECPRGAHTWLMPQEGAQEGGLKTMGLTDTAIHWTPAVIPQWNFGFPAMEGLEADVVMKCIWEQLQVSELRKKTDIDV